MKQNKYKLILSLLLIGGLIFGYVILHKVNIEDGHDATCHQNDTYLSDYIYISNLGVNLKSYCDTDDVKLINAYYDYLFTRCYNNNLYNVSGIDDLHYKQKLSSPKLFPYRSEEPNALASESIEAFPNHLIEKNYVKIQDSWIYFNILDEILSSNNNIDSSWVLAGDLISLQILISIKNWINNYNEVLNLFKSKVNDVRWARMKKLALECSSNKGDNYNILFNSEEEFQRLAQPLGLRLNKNDLIKSYQQLYIKM